MSSEIQTNSASSELNLILQDVIKQQKIHEAKIHLKADSVKGDGYLGKLKFVEVQGKNDEGDVILHLIVKQASKSDVVRARFPLRAIFLREIYFYTSIFPTMKEFQKEFKVHKPFLAVPRIFASVTEEKREALVLEDIKDRGFKMWNRMLPMDVEHVALAMKEYGRLHAVSFAMAKKIPEKWKQIVQDCVEVFANSPEHTMHIFGKNFDNFLETYGHGLAEGIKKKMMKLKAEMPAFRKRLMVQNGYSVVLHGDCWCNNMMFKYEDNNNPTRPTEICFLDFQLSRIANPVLDISYFFCCCNSEETMSKFGHFLDVYYESLQGNLSVYGCSADELYPRTVFNEDCRSNFRYGLLLALMIVRLMLSEEREVPQVEDVEKSEKQVLELFFYESQNEEKYAERIKTLLFHLDRMDFL